MALRAAVASVGQGAVRGMRCFSVTSNFPFIPPQTNQVDKTPPAEPSTNLFVSGIFILILILFNY